MTGLDQLDQNALGIAALIFSVVALLQMCLLVFRRLLLSAEGYHRCTESVIGLWSKGTYRRFNMKEFQFEVIFESPIISIASLINKSHPIRKEEIFYVDGTPTSYRDTKLFEPDQEQIRERKRIQKVHMADDEQSTWITLLSSLQRKELRSRAWDKQVRSRNRHINGVIKGPEYEVAVGIQVKIRSWNCVPARVTRPYATTTIAHVVEMLASIGMYWRVFDQIQWKLRAEGNGFIVTSDIDQSLGVIIRFTVTGASSFEKNSVIPSNHIKELCFGSVPNIFEDGKHLGENSESQGLFLNFGSQNDVELTLESIGCMSEITKRYKKNHKHLFPVSFEIIGMLGKVVRLRGSAFKMIPNPTQDYWLKKVGTKPSWSIIRLMNAFQKKLTELAELEDYSSIHPEKHVISAIIEQWQETESLGYTNEYDLDIEVQEKIHDILDQRTEFLLDGTKQTDVLRVIVAHLDKVTKALNDDTSPLSFINSVNKEEALINFYFDTILFSITDGADTDEKEQKHIIWVSLLFRMLCWLLLHDWDKHDKCRVPPGLKGSGMPIYIE
ncbi:hypothetical protein ACHAPC_011162 [Botrytis cinerea]